MQQKVYYPSLILIIFIYLLSNALELVNNGIYWDDWTLFNTSYEAIKAQFDGNGLFYLTPIHAGLQSLPSPALWYGWLTVLLTMGTFLLLRKILLHYWEKKYVNWFIAIFSVAPFFIARNSMICFPYTLHLFVFVLATFLLQLATIKKSIVFRILSLACYFLSFPVNSLIFMYVLPIAGLFLIQYPIANLRSERYRYFLKPRFLVRNVDLLMLPFIFWIVRSHYLMPTGEYAKIGYNDLSLKNLLLAPVRFLYPIKLSLLDAVDVVVDNIFGKSILATIGIIVILIVVIRLLKKKNSITDADFSVNNRSSCAMLATGFIVFLIGSFPYVLVNKMPSFDGFQSRNQLLLGFGFVLMLLGFVFYVVKPRLTSMAFLVIYLSFTATTFSLNGSFVYTWLEQESLVHNFKRANLMKEDVVLIKDMDPEDALAEGMNFYVLTGIYKSATGKEDKLIIGEDAINSKFIESDVINVAYMYNMTSFDFKSLHTDKRTHLNVSRGALTLTPTSAFVLVFDYYFNKAKFEKEIGNVINVSESAV